MFGVCSWSQTVNIVSLCFFAFWRWIVVVSMINTLCQRFLCPRWSRWISMESNVVSNVFSLFLNRMIFFSVTVLFFFFLYLTRFAQFQPGTISYMFCCFSCTKECHQLKSNETNEQTNKNQLQISKYTDAFSFIEKKPTGKIYRWNMSWNDCCSFVINFTPCLLLFFLSAVNIGCNSTFFILF